MENYYKELQSYLGLESLEQAKLYDCLEGEFLEMGEWGSKIVTYLRAVLSRNKRYKTFIQPGDQELMKKVFKDSLDILKSELKNYGSIQRNQALDAGGQSEPIAKLPGNVRSERTPGGSSSREEPGRNMGENSGRNSE